MNEIKIKLIYVCKVDLYDEKNNNILISSPISESKKYLKTTRRKKQHTINNLLERVQQKFSASIHFVTNIELHSAILKITDTCFKEM